MVVKVDMNVLRIQGLILSTNEAGKKLKTPVSTQNGLAFLKISETWVEINLLFLREHACINL